jgi:uncharacterized protein YifN (PemK superfamily)
MPVPFQPKPRTVLYCDFEGFIEPEMIKRRPVIVLAAHKRNSKLVTVVPLSTTAPALLETHHVKLLQNPLPSGQAVEVWAKCDMVAVVSTERLDLIRTGKRLQNGKREYVVPRIGHEQFGAIRMGVVSALGLAPAIALGDATSGQ